ncbi:MAG: alginate export family protein [Candidatus Omnitrophica bacterium]|nr:alginate export family protein [Candidatus Omnitrophota bacterium]
MRFIKTICILALVLGLTGLAYAETQSVKISGDLTIRGLFRGNYDMDASHREVDRADLQGNLAQPMSFQPRIGISDDWDSHFMTTAEVEIEADLTDNVGAVIRLFNQRDWDARTKNINQTTWMNGTAAETGYATNADEFNVALDLAYIELKEFLYSPLSLKIGRQDIWLGKGFIMGVQQRNPNDTISAPEYTVMNSFDAIRGTLDFDPWTLDLIYAKITENAIQDIDDVDLYGANLGYIFDSYNAEAEAYMFAKRDDSIETWNIDSNNNIYTLGIRGSADPIEDWTTAIEAAVQFGNYIGARNQLEARARRAWALDASIECRYFQDKYPWKPKLGLEYILYSGDEHIADENPTTNGTYTGWDIMYRGRFPSAIRSWYGIYYASAQDMLSQRRDILQRFPDAAYTNQQQIILAGSIQPTESLTVDAKYFNFWQMYATRSPDFSQPNAMPGLLWRDNNKYLGSEVDVEATWDYTEDVSFGLLAAWFFPGAHYQDGSNSIVTDVVGTVSLSF